VKDVRHTGPRLARRVARLGGEYHPQPARRDMPHRRAHRVEARGGEVALRRIVSAAGAVLVRVRKRVRVRIRVRVRVRARVSGQREGCVARVRVRARVSRSSPPLARCPARRHRRAAPTTLCVPCVCVPYVYASGDGPVRMR